MWIARIKSEVPYIKDRTWSKSERSQEISILQINIKKIIELYFPEYSAQVVTSDLNDSIKAIICALSNIYSSSKYNGSKSVQIRKALFNNSVFKAETGSVYKGALTIYPMLCNSTHNNPSSIIERTIKNNYFVMNTKSENSEATLTVIYACMKDVINCIQNILANHSKSEALD